ncbi:MFS transporter [Neogemmobacter tilapiae]|uniref:MFS transporter n=1 Tax=Neogemmobacter tilapiae TaxID=875041 RepID=A0A918TKL7_9RHOB|nr:MFS transporter [Gemmobacter tilapiae]GHC51359.1 MFS transporter [Gemmobacter tilapiae]
MEATFDTQQGQSTQPWAAVRCLSLMTFVLVASEFMPVSLLTPLARDLGITEGQAGQAIAFSGLFAVLTSLFGNGLLSNIDRRTVVVLYTLILVLGGLLTSLAPDYLTFMLGRALIGVSIGGFWSLSTAILARIVPAADLPKAIAMLQGGTAFAFVIAAPLGSFLGGLIGWRGAFFTIVPVALLAALWQMRAVPSLPADTAVSVGRMVGLLRQRVFALGMISITLAFMGQFALSTYLRPFLEGVTGLTVNPLSLVLLGLGLTGLLGTLIVGFLLRRYLASVLIGLPLVLGLIALLLIPFGPYALPIAFLLMLWGLFITPIPVAWNTWMTKAVPDQLEAAGGLQVALIQFAITTGAFAGGFLFDLAGWQSTFFLAAVLFAGSVFFARLTLPKPKGQTDG